MSDTNSPLNSLLIDEEELSKRADDLLVTMLRPYITIVKSSHEVQLTTTGASLKNSSKVLVTLSARLAMKRLKLIDDDTMSQKDLIRALQEEGVAEGSVKSALNYLRKEKLVSRTAAARYFIGLDKLTRLQTELGRNKNE